MKRPMMFNCVWLVPLCHTTESLYVCLMSPLLVLNISKTSHALSYSFRWNIVKDNDEKYKAYKFNYTDDLENKGMNKELREEYRNRHIPYSVMKKSIFSDI